MKWQDRAYLAGIVDGEGCISLGRRKGKYITPTLQVTNTDYRLMAWLQERMGGSVYSNKEARPNRKQCWIWSVAGQKAKRAVADARPFLVIKDRQADIVLGLHRETHIRRDSLGRLCTTLTDQQHQVNADALSAIRSLNRRGVSP